MESQENMPRQLSSTSSRWGLTALVLALAATAGISLFYFVREHRQARDLAATSALTAASQAPAPAKPGSASPEPPAMPKRVHARATTHPIAARRTPADDPRFNQMQEQLSDQQKQLAGTREEVERARNDLDGKLDATRADLDGKLNATRADLDGKLSSTRDELNGSIARTHAQLVALEKRGERTYYEFQLDKSKNFQRVGPISLSLRKVNDKHKSFNLTMIVDDFKLDKKNVNLYEPVWITLTDRPQPVELVVNRVSKDKVQGYLSESKYKKSELSVSAPAPVGSPAPADKTQNATSQNGTSQSAAIPR